MKFRLVIVKLKGGLGNQMFQYALGKHLSLKKKCPIRLDLIFMKHDKLKNYELDRLNIPDNKKTRFFEEIIYYMINIFPRFFPFYKYIRQKSRKFNPQILRLISPFPGAKEGIYYERKEPNELWQNHIARVQSVGYLKKLYLIGISDDCSRFIVGAQYFKMQKKENVFSWGNNSPH